MNKKTLMLTQGAVIAAVYVALVLIFQPISFGPIQFRIAEAMTILPIFTPAAIPGLFIGCVISNALGGAVIWDVIFGSVATLLGAIGTWYAGRIFKNKKALYVFAPLAPLASNALIIPFVLKYAYGLEGLLPFFMLTVGIGEVIACYGLGLSLFFALAKTPVFRQKIL